MSLFSLDDIIDMLNYVPQTFDHVILLEQYTATDWKEYAFESVLELFRSGERVISNVVYIGDAFRLGLVAWAPQATILKNAKNELFIKVLRGCLTRESPDGDIDHLTVENVYRIDTHDETTFKNETDDVVFTLHIYSSEESENGSTD
jgi:hypothetical protein